MLSKENAVLEIPCSVKKKKDLGKIFIAVLIIMPSFVYVTLSEAETIAAL